jgi:hypothetical protein
MRVMSHVTDVQDGKHGVLRHLCVRHAVLSKRRALPTKIVRCLIAHVGAVALLLLTALTNNELVGDSRDSNLPAFPDQHHKGFHPRGIVQQSLTVGHVT